jgi:exopolysaccharide production protein ExoQ
VSTADRGGRAVRRLLSSADFARAFTLAALGAAFGSFAILRTAGTVAFLTIVTGLCLLGAGMLIARRREISLLRLVPTTLVVFLAWALVSAFWSDAPAHTVLSWLGLAGLALLAIVIGHVRDTLQTVRALGDVLRVLLSLSLGLEILSGILLDMPIPFLGILGNIAIGGPVQGIFGTRNLLGFATVIALITFLVEWRTASVRPGTAVFSVAVASILAILSDSPTVLVLAVATALATAALALVRHTTPRHRPTVQWIFAALVAVGLVVAYVLRHQIIRFLGAGSDFFTRADLWNELLEWVRSFPVQGWGWFGPWQLDEVPFAVINSRLGEHHQSALNAFFDVLLQLGWVGLLLFLALGGVALVRSWLLASQRRSVVYAWTPLVLIALLVNSMFESFTLIGFGWLLLVLCAVRAGLSRSWRERIDQVEVDPPLPPEPEQTPRA